MGLENPRRAATVEQCCATRGHGFTGWSQCGQLQLHIESLNRGTVSELEARLTIVVHEMDTRARDSCGFDSSRSGGDAEQRGEATEVSTERARKSRPAPDDVKRIFGIEATWRLRLLGVRATDRAYLAGQLQMSGADGPRAWADRRRDAGALQNLRSWTAWGTSAGRAEETGDLIFRPVGRRRSARRQLAARHRGGRSRQPDSAGPRRSSSGRTASSAETRDLGRTAPTSAASDNWNRNRAERQCRPRRAGEKAAAHAGTALATRSAKAHGAGTSSPRSAVSARQKLGGVGQAVDSTQAT